MTTMHHVFLASCPFNLPCLSVLSCHPCQAFGNAKTAHNNNSSRFGKFIQVNYLESGVVRGYVINSGCMFDLFLFMCLFCSFTTKHFQEDFTQSQVMWLCLHYNTIKGHCNYCFWVIYPHQHRLSPVPSSLLFYDWSCGSFSELCVCTCMRVHVCACTDWNFQPLACPSFFSAVRLWLGAASKYG